MDWYLRTAITTLMTPDATLLLCGSGPMHASHTGQWLDINQIIYAYAGDEHLETIEASTLTAISDVVVDRPSKTFAPAATQGLHGGSPAWMPATQGIWRQQLEDTAKWDTDIADSAGYGAGS